VEFYSESLNLSQFPGPDHDQVLRDHFRRKYKGVQPDLIVAVMGPSLDFLLRHRSLFPGVPIVFCGADPSDLEGKTLGENVTGLVVKRDFAPTIEIALKLQPSTRTVFVVGGASRFDRQLQAIARRDFAPFESRVTITYLTALPMSNLLSTLSRLPPDSVILYLTFFADSAGFTFVPHEALSRVAGAANGVPSSELERIFEHFVTSKPQGLGMGLAISRSIVEANGGTIWATRNEDRGLTLHVAPPASRLPAPRTSSPAHPI
jgi:hypothetical protein